MPPLNTKIWTARFQAIWVIAAGVLTIVQTDAARWGSSWRRYTSTSSLVFCCIILTSVCANALHSKDSDRIRSTVLVALAVSVYMSVLSLKLEDDTGLGFASFAVAVLASLVWRLDDDFTRNQTMMMGSFVVVALGTGCSIIGMLVQYIIVASPELRANSLIGVTSAAALSGLLVAISFGHRALPVAYQQERLPGIVRWPAVASASIAIVAFGSASMRLIMQGRSLFVEIGTEVSIATAYLVITGFGCVGCTAFALKKWHVGFSTRLVGLWYFLWGVAAGLLQGGFIWLASTFFLLAHSIAFIMVDNVLLSSSCFASVWVSLAIANSIASANRDGLRSASLGDDLS